MSQSLDITDFSGGTTDNYLDAALNKYKEADNQLIKTNKKLFTRFGTDIYDAENFLSPAGNSRIASIPKLTGDIIFFQSLRRVFYADVSSPTEITGPTSNVALAAGTAANYPSFAEWNGHLLLTTDAFGSVMKVYRDSGSTLRVRNAGLPKITLINMIALANDLKAKFNAHIADSTEHTSGTDTINEVTSTDAYDFPSLVDLINEFLTRYDDHEGDAELASGWAYHAGQEASDHSLLTTTQPQTLTECKTILDDLKAKYNAHDTDTSAHGTDTLHQSSVFSEPQIAFGSGALQYTYTFCAKFTYTVGNQTFIDRGPTYAITKTSMDAPDSSTVTISSIPVIANGTTENFATTDIVWEIYRTEGNKTTSYFVKEVTNGTTSTTDNNSDSSINTNIVVYTDGGILDNDPPPQAKFIVVSNDVAWYGHVKEGGQVRKNRIRQSVKFDIDSCPESLTVDLEDELVGMGAVASYVIAVCKNTVYRLEGARDASGRGVTVKTEISRGVGGVNHLSIVNTPMGVFFGGTSGFYFTDAFKVIKLTPQLNKRYAEITETDTQKARICGNYIPLDDRIYWGVTQDSASTDNDRIWALDLKWPFTSEQEGAVFTHITPDSDSFSPTALQTDIDNTIVIGDRRGYFLKFNESSLTDPKIDISESDPDNWQTLPIVYNYEGPGINFGSSNQRKVATHLTVVADNVTHLSLQPGGKNDDSGFFKELSEIRVRDVIVWRDPFAPVWRPTPDGYPWRTFPLIIEKRRFPKESLRFLYKQMQLTNSRTIIYRSDDYGLAAVSDTTDPNKTATLSGLFDWPSDAAGYLIAFESDNYVREYLISVRTATVLTFVDLANSVTLGASKKWVIRGVKKREKLNLVSYSIEWEALTSSHSQYRGITGGNE